MSSLASRVCGVERADGSAPQWGLCYPFPMQRRTRSRGAAAALASVALWGGACGYQLVRTGQSFGPDVDRVAVKPMVNNSYEPGVEVIVSDALRREFLKRGGVQVVNEPSRADLVVGGAVLPIETRVSATSAVSAALEYQITLEIQMSAERRNGAAVSLEPPTFTAWELYLSSADVEAERKNRLEAIRRLATVLAVRVHDALVTKFTP